MFYLGFDKVAGVGGALKKFVGSGAQKVPTPSVFKNLGTKVVRDPVSTAKTIASHSNVAAARMERGLAASKAPKNIVKVKGSPEGAAKALGGKQPPPTAAKSAPSEGGTKTLAQHAEAAKNWIKANPLKSAGIGAGAGYLAAKATSGQQQ